MRVFGRGLILAAFLCASVPSVVGAAPILYQQPDGPAACTFSGATEACGMFGIDPVSALFEGEFENANDIALFRFTLTGGSFTFSAFTTSAATGGFDPVLALYGEDGAQLQYSTPDGGPFLTNNDDSDGQIDARIPELIPSLLLDSGTYFLALTLTGNFPHELLADGLGGFDWALDPSCGGVNLEDPTVCPSLGLASGFAFRTELVPATPPVPEPATLILMGSGAVAALVRRRSRKRE